MKPVYMIRFFLLILFLPLMGTAQKFTAVDLKQLKLYSSGTFSNEAQAKADTHFVKAVLKVQPIWQKRKDGTWLFAERNDTGRSFQVWHFYLQDDNTLVMQFLNFKESAKAVQLSNNINQDANLFLYNLFTRYGCEVYLQKTKTGYSGSSTGKDCFANAAGTEYVSSTIELTKNSIAWQQTTFDKDDKEVAVTLSGNYNFIKQVKSLK